MKQRSLVRTVPPNDIFFMLYFSLFWSRNLLLGYVRATLMRLPYIWEHVDLILTAIMVLLFVLALPTFFNRIYVKDLMILMGIYLVFSLYYVFFPDNRYYYNLYAQEIVQEVFPVFLLGACLCYGDNQKLMDWLYKLSLVTVYSFCSYTLLFHAMGSLEVRAGDMNSAYLLLPHVCMVYGGVMRKPGVFNIVGFIMGALMLLFLGTRGALLCLGTLVILATLCSNRVKRPGWFLAGGAFLLLVFFAFGLLDFLYNIADNLGLSLRIFKKLEAGAITDSSGRVVISDRVKEYIALHPMLGMGIFADRQVAAGKYAHNLFLESLIDFGVVGAIPLLGLVFTVLYRAFRHLRKNGRSREQMLMLSLFCSVVVKLMISGSYLLEPNFFLLLGYACAVCREIPSTGLGRGSYGPDLQRRKLRR